MGRVMSTASITSLKQYSSALTSVTSALEVINVMRSINLRFTYLLAYLLTYVLTFVVSSDTLCLMGVPDAREKRFGPRTPSWNIRLQIAAKPSVLCCHLANTNENLGGLATTIPPFAKLLWSVFD